MSSFFFYPYSLFNFKETLEMEINSVDAKPSEELLQTSNKKTLSDLLARQLKIMEGLQDTKTINFLIAAAHLCHMDTSLAERVWLDIFPNAWKILSENQQNVRQQSPFISLIDPSPVF